MKSQAGIWIDHRRAVVVFITEGAERVEHIDSGLDHGKFSGNGAKSGAEDHRDHKFTAHLTQYYDNVIAHVATSQSILLMGPGEGKGELQKELVRKGLGKQIVGVETTDKMSDHQIVAMVRKHYLEHAGAAA